MASTNPSSTNWNRAVNAIRTGEIYNPKITDVADTLFTAVSSYIEQNPFITWTSDPYLTSEIIRQYLKTGNSTFVVSAVQPLGGKKVEISNVDGLKTQIESIPIKTKIDQLQFVNSETSDSLRSYKSIAAVIAPAVVKRRATFLYAYLVLVNKLNYLDNGIADLLGDIDHIPGAANQISDLTDKNKDLIDTIESLRDIIKNMLLFHSENEHNWLTTLNTNIPVNDYKKVQNALQQLKTPAQPGTGPTGSTGTQ